MKEYDDYEEMNASQIVEYLQEIINDDRNNTVPYRDFFEWFAAQAKYKQKEIAQEIDKLNIKDMLLSTIFDSGVQNEIGQYQQDNSFDIEQGILEAFIALSSSKEKAVAVFIKAGASRTLIENCLDDESLDIEKITFGDSDALSLLQSAAIHRKYTENAIKKMDKVPSSAVYYSVIGKNNRILRMLLDKEIVYTDFYSQDSIMEEAFKRREKDIELTEALLEKGFSPNVETSFRRKKKSLLSVAAKNNELETVELLIKYNAKIDENDPNIDLINEVSVALLLDDYEQVIDDISPGEQPSSIANKLRSNLTLIIQDFAKQRGIEVKIAEENLLKIVENHDKNLAGAAYIYSCLEKIGLEKVADLFANTFCSKNQDIIDHKLLRDTSRALTIATSLKQEGGIETKQLDLEKLVNISEKLKGHVSDRKEIRSMSSDKNTSKRNSRSEGQGRG